MLRKLYSQSQDQTILFLDEPMRSWPSPLTKEKSKAASSSTGSKQIPQHIPQGFHLRFDELLRIR